MSESTWLPNLVGGTSMWKLAVDLNEPKFFDGRLLVPETEGSESLPVTVRWDLTGLIPLAEAQAKHPEESAAAIKDFQAALERVAKVFATPNSGFDKYKSAFTVPALDASPERASDANYFYSEAKKKLFVINWGASPRSMGGKAEYVFGFEDWAQKFGATAAVAAGVAVAKAADQAAPKTAEETKKAEEQKKEDEKKKDEEKKKSARPWWFWPFIALAGIALVLLALFLLKACEVPANVDLTEAGMKANLPDGSKILPDGAILLPDGGIFVLSVDAGADTDAATDAGMDASSTDAGAEAAAADAGSDAGADAGTKKKDGGAADDDDDDDDSTLTVVPGSSGGGSGGKIIVKTFPGGAAGSKTSVHRKHYSDDATHWRVSGATNKVSRTEDSGKRFDVWLQPGQSFEGVKVEWQDASGKWHVH